MVNLAANPKEKVVDLEYKLFIEIRRKIVIYLSLSKIIFKILIKYIDKYQYTEYNTI